MDQEAIKSYLLSKNHAYLDYPFDDVTPVYKVGKKMFALTGNIGGLSINLKCDPDDALYLRDAHEAIVPGYHMNKKHWNTVIVDGSLEEAFIKDMIDRSYDLVLKSMTKKEREAL